MMCFLDTVCIEQVEASAMFNANNTELFLPRVDYFYRFTWMMMHLCLFDVILRNISNIVSVLAAVFHSFLDRYNNTI